MSSAATVASADALAGALAEAVQPGDMVVCLGAGDITKWAAGLAAGIEARKPASAAIENSAFLNFSRASAHFS